MYEPSSIVPAWIVGSPLTKLESFREEIFPSLMAKIKLESTADTMRNLSNSSPNLALRVKTLVGLKGIGLVAISRTVRPCVSYLRVPLLPFPHVMYIYGSLSPMSSLTIISFMQAKFYI